MVERPPRVVRSTLKMELGSMIAMVRRSEAAHKQTGYICSATLRAERVPCSAHGQDFR
ncbi:MAG: hypothetical protein EXS10_03385 [Phycisphaerales bacterium]|nr:hypothetical protein [Phycisphaerales bacterium]